MIKQRWGLDRNVLRPTPGDPRGAEQHHWNTGAKENQQLNPGGPSNRQKAVFTTILCLIHMKLYDLYFLLIYAKRVPKKAMSSGFFSILVVSSYRIWRLLVMKQCKYGSAEVRKVTLAILFDYLSHVMRKPVFGVCGQVRLKTLQWQL